MASYLLGDEFCMSKEGRDLLYGPAKVKKELYKLMKEAEIPEDHLDITYTVKNVVKIPKV